MKSCRLTILACLLAVFPAHADDTYAVSPSFALTTLDPLGTIVGVSAGFTLDTTAQSGLTGYGVSAFVLDTRPPTVTEPTSAEVTIISNNSIALTGYTGPGGYVIIPGIIGNLPVTSIGNGAFQNNATITSVFIPASVTGIGVGAFANCPALMAITVDPANPTF